MKRKIAAILAADIAGYSKLVAEDEEETLRRLASYRAVFDDFIARGSGRIFNTAGDAVLAEFPSAVEAVRCAIDVQESVRTRNLAYPPSRQMSFRIGITVGDVVERDGDLLGDGVNIAARLEGLAQAGGVCVSRTVYEQVANKLSVQFTDIGEQEVKNIPNPVHAFALMLGPDEGRAQPLLKQKKPARAPIWLWPTGIGLAAVAVLGLAAVGIFFAIGSRPPTTVPPVADQKSSQKSVQRQAEMLVPETVPFISDRDRVTIRDFYMPAPDHKAFAISTSQIGIATGQSDDDTAKAAALANCQRASGDASGRRCELYAVGTAIVYSGGRPSVPPGPWLFRDPSIERPFDVEAIPLVSASSRSTLAKFYALPGNHPKALALSPRGNFHEYRNQSSHEEAMRRALEGCGSAGIACTIIALDDTFVVPIPTTMKVTGFFSAASHSVLAPEARNDIAQRIGNATSGWKAVAVGSSGHAGMMLKAASEQDAVDGALADCSRHDRNCRVIAIGPFSVEPLTANDRRPSPRPAQRQAEMLVPETVPFTYDRDRLTIRDLYMSAPDHKALAISFSQMGIATGQVDDETAKTAALANCKKANQAASSDWPCELYAVGAVVVYSGGHPSMPPQPWVVRDSSIERPFDVDAVPLLNASSRSNLAKFYAIPGNHPKALALSPRGTSWSNRNQSSHEEAMRRALEVCGSAGIACMIIALDDSFVVPIPTTAKVTGFFSAASNLALAPESRNDIAQQIGSVASGWKAVAVGSGGHAGIMVNAASEQEAVEGALADCSGHDRDCRVIAIGPFSVEPFKPPPPSNANATANPTDAR
jgi:adenylate cyclase